MDLKEAIDRIEFEIEEDLRDKSFTIAGRMDIERIKQAKNELNTLNKGIDELIKQCENEILEYEEFFKPNSKIHQLIFSEDEYYATINFRNKLKKLKGE